MMADENTTTPPAPTTPPHIDFTKPPAAPGEQRTTPAPPSVSLPVDEYQRFRGLERQLADYQTAKQAEVDAKEQERIKALADKGEIESALNEQKRIWETKHLDAEKRFKELEGQILAEKYESTVSAFMTEVEWVGDTPEQRAEAALMFKLRVQSDLETVRLADGSIKVRDKASGRPAAEVLRERLSDPKLSFLIASKNRGGSGGDGTRTPANQNAPEPGSLEAIAADYKAKQGRYAPMGLGPVG